MGLVEAFQKKEYPPLLVRGTCLEEALWILDLNRNKIKSHVELISAWAVEEGFEFYQAQSRKPLPKNYTFKNVRMEAINWATPSSGLKYIHGKNHPFVPKYNPFTEETTLPPQHQEFYDDTRLGVVIHFNPKILNHHCRIDPWSNSDKLNSLQIYLTDNPDPECIDYVEPIGPMDKEVLENKLPDNIKVPDCLFEDYYEMGSTIHEESNRSNKKHYMSFPIFSSP
jgi:hypothetical protein